MLLSFLFGFSDQCVYQHLYISTLVLEPIQPPSLSAPTTASCQGHPPKSFGLSILLHLHYQTQVTATISNLDKNSATQPLLRISAVIIPLQRKGLRQNLINVIKAISYVKHIKDSSDKDQDLCQGLCPPPQGLSPWFPLLPTTLAAIIQTFRSAALPPQGFAQATLSS